MHNQQGWHLPCRTGQLSRAHLNEQVQLVVGVDPVRAVVLELQVQGSAEHSLPQLRWQVT